jgi:hypothetical protein
MSQNRVRLFLFHFPCTFDGPWIVKPEADARFPSRTPELGKQQELGMFDAEFFGILILKVSKPLQYVQVLR